MSDLSLKFGLAPIALPDSRLLILGSLPGEASLAAAQYYAHPANQFWRLVGAAINEDLAGVGYAERLALLARHRIALWDTVAAATRRGSLDQALRVQALQPVPALVRDLPDLRAIVCNGTKAAALVARMEGLDGLARLDLPSSSPANTLPFAEKLRPWMAIADYL